MNFKLTKELDTHRKSNVLSLMGFDTILSIYSQLTQGPPLKIKLSPLLY